MVNDRLKKRKIRERKRNKRHERSLFLIVCEGKKTEPSYFKDFKLATRKVVDITIDGIGRNTSSLIEETEKIKENLEHKNGIEFDQVWCVFDRDTFSPNLFNSAISMAKKRKFKVAYSNEAFEIWYLLHFNLYTSAIDRRSLGKKLSQLIKREFGHKYMKNDDRMYEYLKSRQQQAIDNAISLLEHHKETSCINPEKNNPSTTVHLLVMELNKYMTKED